MKTVLYMNGKKSSRKAVKELVGEERMKTILAMAKDGFLHDPLEQQSFFLGGNKMLTVTFA